MYTYMYVLYDYWKVSWLISIDTVFTWIWLFIASRRVIQIVVDDWWGKYLVWLVCLFQKQGSRAPFSSGYVPYPHSKRASWVLLTKLLAPVHSWQLAACDYALINSSMTWSKLPGPGLQPPVKDSDLFQTNQSPGIWPNSQSEARCQHQCLPSIRWSQYNWMTLSWHWIHIYHYHLTIFTKQVITRLDS